MAYQAVMTVVVFIPLMFFLLFIVTMMLNDYGFEHIIKYMTHYKTILAKKGLTLHTLPSASSDAAPCEIDFQLTGHDICVTRGGWEMYRIVQKIKHNQISRTQLMMMSDTPYCKVPR